MAPKYIFEDYRYFVLINRTSFSYTIWFEWPCSRFRSLKIEGSTSRFNIETVEFIFVTDKKILWIISPEGELVFCNNTEGLLQELSFPEESEEWRLFMDSFKFSFKDGFWRKLKIYSYTWNICAHLKAIAMLTRLQRGYTKFSCFLCEWDSRTRNRHYVVKKTVDKERVDPGSQKCKWRPFSLKWKNSPIHINLGLMEKIVKAMNKDGEGFQNQNSPKSAMQNWKKEFV